MNALMQSFQFEASPVRVVTLEDRPWWIATDLSGLLGYDKVSNMLRLLDEDQKGAHKVSTLGGEQSLTIITEGGMWRCLFGSRRPEAKRFRRWVEDVLLPTLRRTGRFDMNDEDDASLAFPSPELGTSHDLEKLRVAALLVKTTNSVWGQKAARQMWVKLGFPVPASDLPPPPAAPQDREPAPAAPAEGGIADWGVACAVSPSRRDATHVSELFASYEAWCSRMGHWTMPADKFARAVTLLFGHEEHPEMIRVIVKRR